MIYNKFTPYTAILNPDETLEVSWLLRPGSGYYWDDTLVLTFDPLKKFGDSVNESWDSVEYLEKLLKKIKKESYGSKKVKGLRKKLKLMGKDSLDDVVEVGQLLEYAFKLVEDATKTDIMA